MQISRKVWRRYSENLAKLNGIAKGTMEKYLTTHGYATEEERQALIAYAYGIATKYGEAAAEYACQMYDATSELEGLTLPPAEPAPTASYGEVAKAVNGTLKYVLAAEMVGTAVGRLVKMAGQDTTMKNAIRDKAYFAWIPEGDTCVFCISIAAEGWKRATAAALAGGHAEHIHGNCDCAYAIKHDKDTEYGGYDPGKYAAQIADAEGDTEEEKLNSMRRENYARHKDEINEQKRMTYRERAEILNNSAATEEDVD